MTKSIFTDNYQLFLKRLISIRKNANITQQELAKKLGKPQSFVSKYENAERRIDIIEAIEILNALNFDPNLLMAITIQEWKN